MRVQLQSFIDFLSYIIQDKEIGCVRVYERVSELGEGDTGPESDRWDQMGETMYGDDAFDEFGYSVAVNDI